MTAEIIQFKPWLEAYQEVARIILQAENDEIEDWLAGEMEKVEHSDDEISTELGDAIDKEMWGQE